MVLDVVLVKTYVTSFVREEFDVRIQSYVGLTLSISIVQYTTI